MNSIYRFRLIVISLFIFVLSINNLKAETVNKIIVEGNNRVSPETVIMFSGVSVNDDLSENNLNQVLKQLYGSNFFELVSVKIENKPCTSGLCHFFQFTLDIPLTSPGRLLSSSSQVVNLSPEAIFLTRGQSPSTDNSNG